MMLITMSAIQHSGQTRGSQSGLLSYNSSEEINTEVAHIERDTILSCGGIYTFISAIRTINETSTSNQIYVHFKSDDAVVASGFDFQLNIHIKIYYLNYIYNAYFN